MCCDFTNHDHHKKVGNVLVVTEKHQFALFVATTTKEYLEMWWS